VYWTVAGDGFEAGSLLRLPSGATSPITLATSLAWPRSVTLVHSAVIWLEQGIDFRSTGALRKIATNGGEVTTIATKGAGVPIDGLVGVMGPSIVFAVKGALYAVPMAGGAARVLVDGLMAITKVTADDDAAYIARMSQHAPSIEILRVDASGTTAVLASLEPTVDAMKLASRSLFVLNNSRSTTSPGRIVKIDTRSGAVAEVISGLPFACGLTVDDSHVYWTDERGTVLKRIKAW
jgi:hypothetical protein